jgi:tellurite resistance protein
MKVFDGFDEDRLPDLAQECSTLLQDPEGLEHALKLLRASLPVRLRETAYAIACDIAAADGYASQEELRLLEMLRHRLEIDRLIAAAIERGARARHMTM